ncbi:MAG: hypothetical protein FWD23_15355, partial [Oscillospiraceae bacterium]|nr:hypothetical protein [Oscillospiraceae bacterium]
LSRYVTPSADHRLNITTRFTLARPFNKEDTVIYTEQNPEVSVMADRCRVLKIGGELVTYTGYKTEPPYCFTGIERGAFATEIGTYPAGLIFGILDVSEFGATSVYLDQNSSLQDEIAEKIADAYNTGFKFVYFDGSEGVNTPCGFHVPNAQYRIYKKLSPPPLFTEGAAKAHFSWHMLSGGNAFDVFPPEVFKEKIRRFPCEEAPRMRQDFTRINFGWWGYWAPETQPDMWEYATSRAAAWDCPVGLQVNLETFANHPRTPDNFEVIRRWEDVRAKKWLTEKQKEGLKNLEQEHILLINENKEYELIPYYEITGAAGGNKNVRAFVFERNGESYAVYWHASGSGNIEIPLGVENIGLMKDLGEEISINKAENNTVTIPIGSRLYLKSRLPKERLIEAFENAKLHS